jgi:anti-sigma factor RsiW
VDKLFGSERFENGWHPGEDDLLYYADGELSIAKRAEIKTHLEACWTCRAKAEKIQQTISSFIEYLNDGFVPNVDPPPMGWRTFDGKMNRAAAEAVKRPLLSRWCESARNHFLHWGLSVGWTASLLATLGIALVFAHFQSVSPVSANQLIQRATEAQEQRIRRVTHAVVYQKLRVQRRGAPPLENASITWEVWNDPTGGRFRQRVEDAKGQRLIDPRPENPAEKNEAGRNQQLRQDGVFQPPSAHLDLQEVPPILRELDQILKSNRMNQRNPLSPIGYASWRKSIHRQSEEVKETSLADGEKALTLTTAALAPFTANSIVKAELVIRAADWHPVAQRFEVQGENGVRDYDLTETDFEVLASNALPHSIFEDRFVSVPLAVAPPVPAPPQVLPPSAAELVASEVEVLFALHRVRACIGRPISVTRVNSGRIEVKGVVDTEIRKAELLAGLKGIPWVNVKIQTIEESRFELPSQTENLNDNKKNTGASSDQDSNLKTKSEKLVIQDLLEEYFSAARSGGRSSPAQEERDGTSIHQTVAALSHSAVAFSEAALEEAWALRRLAELTSWLKSVELRTSSRRLLELMVRDHLGALRREINQARTLVRPILFELLAHHDLSSVGNEEVASSLPNSEDADWTVASAHLFAAVDRTVRLTRSLFADTRLPVESRDEIMKELLGAFDHLEEEFQNVEVKVSQAFSQRADSLTSMSRPD